MSIPAEKFNELLERYRSGGDKSARNEIVMLCADIIKYAAVSTRNMYAKFTETDDIVNEATLALIAAIDTFKPEKGVKFETYASMRMRGAIIDYIRRMDFIPRSVRKFSKELDKAFGELYNQLGREPSTDEIAQHMNLPKEKLIKLMADSTVSTSLSFEELVYEDNISFLSDEDEATGGVWEVEKGLYLSERNRILAEAIKGLKENQRTVISLYYYEKLRLSDIAQVMGVTESRVSQIHSKAMLSLRYNLEKYIRQ